MAPVDDPMRLSRCISGGEQAHFPHNIPQSVPENNFRDVIPELNPGYLDRTSFTLTSKNVVR